jgi:hypothetical protein
VNDASRLFKKTLMIRGSDTMKTLIPVIVLIMNLAVSPAWSDTQFTLSDYQSLKTRDIKSAQLVLRAMREAVFYSQESKGDTVICASPAQISDNLLIEMFEQEIANPTNVDGHNYEANIPAAFVFVHALKNKGVCR